MVGYFPEGMAYGPQSQDPDDTPMTVVLQCAGASGGGYLSRNEVKAGMEALQEFGTFEGGVFRRQAGSSRASAMWMAIRRSGNTSMAGRWFIPSRATTIRS